MSTKNVQEALLFMGGETEEVNDGVEDGTNPDTTDKDDKTLWCNCDKSAGDECSAACTFQKFSDKEALTPKQKRQRKKDRIGFVKKVYGILFCQLLTTAIIVASTILVPAQKDLIQNSQIWIVAAIVAVISVLVLVLGKTSGDDESVPIVRPVAFHIKQPINYILLFIFTISSSILVAKIAAASSPQIVFEAACLTTAAVLGITIFAMSDSFKKLDGVKEFSIMAPALSAVGICFAVTGLLALAPVQGLTAESAEEGAEPTVNKLTLVYACIGVVLFALIMLFDTNMIIGGKSSMFQLGPECYILGALQLYLEIINMFVLLIVILGAGE